MKTITPAQLDAACAAYARSTGSYPNRAGLRAALHTIDLPTSLAQDKRDHPPSTKTWGQDSGGYWTTEEV